MCKNIYMNLKDGGRFVTLNQSPITPLRDVREFGARVEGVEPLNEGDETIVRLYENMEEMCSFTTYHWSKNTYEECLKKVGFKNIKWSPLNILKEGMEKYPNHNWEKFIHNSYVLILEATK